MRQALQECSTMKLATLTSYFSLFTFLGFTAIAPAIAGRPVFNQPRSTIEQYFGKPWTKLTIFINGDRNDKIVRYTYSPARLRRKFPEFPQATLMVSYRDDRAQSVSLVPNSPIMKGLTIDSDAIVIEKEIEARFFKFVLDYNPGLYKPLHFVGSNAGLSYVNCLGDGVASDYDFNTLNQAAELTYFSLSYTRSCSRPYDKIIFTQDSLGG
jgi:hypothetical protein